MNYLFDQYQRYKNAQLYIEGLRGKNQVFRILEVGANSHKNLEEFLPKDKITYLDLEVPEELQNDSDYVQGDATQMEFADQAFDVVVALDVYEHIPAQKREAFLGEIARVASKGFFICAPFEKEGVHAAECRVNTNFKCMYGYDHPWLEEHLANGLPLMGEAEQFYRDRGVEVTVFSHGDLDLWERLTNIEIASDCNERLQEVAMQIYQYYNKHLFPIDYVSRAYRCFIAGGSSCGFVQEKQAEREKLMEKLEQLENNFWRLYAAQGINASQGRAPEGIFQLYYDTGKGMGMDGVQEMALDSYHASFRREFRTENGREILTLRLDPMIHNGIVKINRLAVYDILGQVVWKGLPESIQCQNLIYHQGMYYLFLDDPQICLENIHHDVVTVEFDYVFWECPVVTENFWRMFIEDMQERQNEYERIRRENEIAKENLVNEMRALQEGHLAQMQAVYQSTSWKITKPYRFLARGIKKIGRVIIPEKVRQGLFVIMHQGFSAFFRKYTVYRHRERAKKYKYMKHTLFPARSILREQRNTKFDKNICFSIIVPLYNTPEKYLLEMIKSCQNQTYGNWELCLADGSDREHAYVGELVRNLAAKDSRIKYKVLEKNGGISENTNAALEMATGDYIALLDHDDILHSSAFYEYMKVICEQGADFIYCDELTFEEKISHIISLHYKPDFAIDNLRANNYICHFSVFSKELLQKVGMFRKDFDGSQDHDMILRLTEQADRIVHVPMMLYFWRSHPASVASDINSKTYAIDAGKRAVLSHLERCGLKGSVESSWAFPTIYNVKYELQGNPKVSIIIPNKDNEEMLSRCLSSITEKSTYSNYEIIVVENNSTEENTFRYYDTLKSNPKIRVLYYKEEGFNYARINNYAVENAEGDYVLFLNNDIEIITPEWIEEMLMYAQREDVGAVGAKLYYPDNTIQHAGVIVGLGEDRCAGSVHHRFSRDDVGYIGRLCYAQDFSAVTAACMAVSKKIFQSVEGFDERFAVAYNDVDLCMKFREAGYLNVWTPCAEAYHYESVSRGYDSAPEKRECFQKEVKLFKEKWQKQIDAGDPYYNRNLTLDAPDFSPSITNN
ncbi:MAG: glycosyltransferase [Clostridiaceae bacterium]|nr:glycosyltransferase [Clostridiaceae bacterium]